MKWPFCGGEVSYDRVQSSHCKIAVLGDSQTGKTTLVKAARFSLVEQIEDIQFDVYRGTFEVIGQPGVQIEILDYPGGFRPNLVLPADLDVIVLCLDVTRTLTLTSVTVRWMPLIRDQCPDQKLLLVGCKHDLINDLETIMTLSSLRENVVTYIDALMIGRLTRSLPYIETSAMNNFRSAKEAFEVAVLRHVGKLSSRHPVFERQRTVEKTFKEIQKEKRKSHVQREHTPSTPDETHTKCISYNKPEAVRCCLALPRTT